MSNNPSGVSTAESKSTEVSCPACNLSFESFDKLMIHALSPEHARNVMQGNLNNNAVSSSNTAEANDILDVTSTTKDEILPGFDINKKVQDVSSSRCNVNGKSPEPNLQKNIAEVAPNSVLRCETCKITCTGQIPYLQHMASTNHLKKLRQLEQIQRYMSEGVSSPKLEESNVSLNAVQVCETCKIQCSGQIPYMQHMNSEAHRKKLRQLEEIQKYMSEGVSSPKLDDCNISPNSVRVCETCKIQCSGQIPYMQHMSSEAHRKKLRQLEEIQKYTSEVDSPLRLSDNNVHQATVGNNNLLFCKICKIECSGVIPYEQHVRGATHLKNVRKVEIIYNNTPQSTVGSNEGDDKKIENSILPNFDMVSTDILENSVKIFTPNEKIDFDKGNETNADPEAGDAICKNDPEHNESEVENKSKQSQDEVSENISGVFSEALDKIDLGEKKILECKTCDVKLGSEEEVACHYESLEHIRKKWGHSNITI